MGILGLRRTRTHAESPTKRSATLRTGESRRNVGCPAYESKLRSRAKNTVETSGRLSPLKTDISQRSQMRKYLVEKERCAGIREQALAMHETKSRKLKHITNAIIEGRE